MFSSPQARRSLRWGGVMFRLLKLGRSLREGIMFSSPQARRSLRWGGVMFSSPQDRVFLEGRSNVLVSQGRSLRAE